MQVLLSHPHWLTRATQIDFASLHVLLFGSLLGPPVQLIPLMYDLGELDAINNLDEIINQSIHPMVWLPAQCLLSLLTMHC